MKYYDINFNKRKSTINYFLKFFSYAEGLNHRFVFELDNRFGFELYKFKLSTSEKRSIKLLLKIFRFIIYRRLNANSEIDEFKNHFIGLIIWSDRDRCKSSKCCHSLTSNAIEIMQFLDNKLPKCEAPKTDFKYALESAIGLLLSSLRCRENIFRYIVFITDGIRDGNKNDFELKNINKNKPIEYKILILCINPTPPKYLKEFAKSIDANLFIYDNYRDLDNLLFSNILENIYENNSDVR